MSRFRVIQPGDTAPDPMAPAPKPDVFDMAVATARKNGATVGVVVYMTDDGEVGYASAGAGTVVLRGLFEEGRDWFLGMSEED